jgi:hypothetical protein
MGRLFFYICLSYIFREMHTEFQLSGRACPGIGGKEDPIYRPRKEFCMHQGTGFFN